ncbi:MAG: glycosyltransferase family 4 protein [Ilyomonas sp.]
MISGKTIFIAHGWSDVSLNYQAKALALKLSKDNKVVFLNAKKTSKSITIINDNLAVHEWPGKRPVGWKDFLFALKLMRKQRPDVIITNFAANDIMLFASWLIGIKKRVCYFHTMVQQHIEDYGKLDWRQRINIFRKGFAFRLATHMLPSTNASKKDLVRYYKVKKEKAFVFPNALPDTIIRNRSEDNTVGFLGRLHRSKGVDVLINAFKKINENNNDCHLVIVGKGPCENELKALVRQLSLEDKIIFKGAIAYDEVKIFLSTLVCLVVSSRMDNLPTVALEAFSVATPVIGSNAGGIPDIISSGENGLLFENENIEQLAKQLEYLLKNKELRNFMSHNARKTFEEKYCIDQLLPRFENLLEKTSS